MSTYGKKTIDLKQMKDALRFSANRTSSIDLTDYGTWVGFNDFIEFAWRALDKRTNRMEKTKLSIAPKEHECPTPPKYEKAFKLFGKQFYTKSTPTPSNKEDV